MTTSTDNEASDNVAYEEMTISERVRYLHNNVRRNAYRLVCISIVNVIIYFTLVAIAYQSNLYQQKDTMLTLENWLYLYTLCDFSIIFFSWIVYATPTFGIFLIMMSLPGLLIIDLRYISGIYVLGMWNDYMYSSVWITVLTYLIWIHISKQFKPLAKLFTLLGVPQNINKKVE